MNTSLSTFMKIAITVVTIGTLIFGAMHDRVSDISDDVAEYIDNS
ncbi:hypothetical protein [Rossellomorea arthrocnemi]|jgi:hypothetical protein|nr:hypothetical protein [Rossellomorea arthrocnemi]